VLLPVFAACGLRRHPILDDALAQIQGRLTEQRNTMRSLVLALALSSLSFSTVAFAQHGGTTEEQKACTRDVQRHCRAVMDQGDLTVLACLKENREKLTASCAQVLKSHGQY
jgi:hypothetical protein